MKFTLAVFFSLLFFGVTFENYLPNLRLLGFTPMGFADSSVGKESTCNAGDLSLGWEDPLEKGKATHSSILA